MTKFNKFNTKFKELINRPKDKDVLLALDISKSTFATMKRNNQIPYDKVISYCKNREINLAWLLDIKKNNDHNT